MAFKDFSLPVVLRTFKLTYGEASLFAAVPVHAPSDWLSLTLAETVPHGLALSNERAGHAVDAVYGAVTTGDNWRFLKLTEAHLTLDADEYMLHQIGKILGIFRTTVTGP